MALDVGATTHYMGRIKIYPQGIETSPDYAEVASRASLTASLMSSAIYVNKEGQRMVNENGDFYDVANTIMDQSDRDYFIFMDHATFETWYSVIGDYISHEKVDQYLENNGGTPLFAHADTIEEVAAIAGVNADNLKAAVERFNGFVAAGKDEDFGRVELYEIGDGPYYLIEEKLCFATTLGGLKTDESMQVLADNDEPIPGLYAAGEIVGGVHGQDALGGCNVGWALTSGRLAGLAASK